MRLRTVINELSCTSFLVADEEVLYHHVLLTPYADAPVPDGVRLLRLCSLTEWESGSVHVDDGQIMMVHVGEKIAPSLEPKTDVIFVAHPSCYSDFRYAFLDLPGLAVLHHARQERMFDAFTSSYDLTQFARKAAAVLANPIMIINTEQRVLASAGLAMDSPDIKEVLEKGYISEEVNSQLAEDGLVEDNRRAHHSVLGNKSRYGTRWVTSIIRYHHLEMGRLDLREQDSPITGFDLELIDYASQLAGVIIERLGAAGNLVGTGSSVLADLISGSFLNEETMRAQMALTQLAKDSTYVIVSFKASRNADRELYAQAGSIVAPLLPNCLWCAEPDCLVLLAPFGNSIGAGFDDYERVGTQLLGNERLARALAHNELMAYVSEPFADLGRAPEHYEQCRDLMSTPAARARGRITLFWENRFITLAHAVSTSGHAEMMYDKRVIAMANYDRDHKTTYLETSVASVRHPGSPADAARSLNIHRNTYFYRMNKIKELFRIDLKDGDDRLALAFTTTVMQGLAH